MILSSTTRRIRVYLGGAITTNELHWLTWWIDHYPGQQQERRDGERGVTTGATEVEIVAAPDSGVQRELRGINVFNSDTANATVTVELFDGTDSRTWINAVLEPDWSLEWQPGGTWHIYDENGVVQSAGGAAGGADGLNRIAAGTQTAGTLATVLFADSNGISFGMSDSTRVTASYTVPSVAGLLSNIRVSAGTTSNLLSALTFADGNGVSFGLNASTVTASHNGLTSQSNQNVTAANGGFAFQTLSFSNANAFSFGTSAGSAITGSYTVPTVTNSSWTVSDAATSGSVAQLAFTNLNGVTLSLSTGAAGSHTIVGSHNALTSQSNQAFSADASSTFQTLTLQDSNGVSFSNNAGALRVTHALQFTSATSAITSAALHTSAALRAIYDGANSISTGTVRFTNANGVSFSINGQTISGSVAAQSNQQMTMFATGNTTLSSTGTSNASSLIFRGSGAASVGITNGSVLIDVAAGAAAITQSIGMSTQTAGGATAGTTGYATGDDILYHFVPGSNITMSQSIDGASGTLSIYGPAAGGGVTYSNYDPHRGAERVAGQQGQATLFVQPMWNVPAFQFGQFVMPVQFTNSSNSSGSATISWWVGIYTSNVSTLSRLMSTSHTTAFTMSGTAGSYSLYAGMRNYIIPWTSTISASDYWVGIVSRTTTGGTNMTISQWLASNPNSNMSGEFGVASNATKAAVPMGQGFYSATTSAIPDSIGFTQIQASGSLNLRPPIFFFQSRTI